MTLSFLKNACHSFLSNMHLFPRKNCNPTTTDEESEKKGNNQVLSRSVLLEPADEKLIILFLEASNNDLVIIFLVPKIKNDEYSLMFQEVS